MARCDHLDDNVLGVVLAGGAGRRLGRDKTALCLPGTDEDFLARAVALLAKVTADVQVSCRTDLPDYAARADRANVPLIPDLYPGEGALRALYSILLQTRRPCLIIPCDLPFLTVEVLSTLLQERQKRSAGVLMTAWRQQKTGFVESLVAVYEPESLPLFQIAVEHGEYRLNSVIPSARRLCLDFDQSRADLFQNVNLPDDWEMACRLADRMNGACPRGNNQ